MNVNISFVVRAKILSFCLFWCFGRKLPLNIVMDGGKILMLLKLKIIVFQPSLPNCFTNRICYVQYEFENTSYQGKAKQLLKFKPSFDYLILWFQNEYGGVLLTYVINSYREILFNWHNYIKIIKKLTHLTVFNACLSTLRQLFGYV